MKQRIAYFLISCFLMLSTLTQAQVSVFSNTTVAACNSWNTNNDWATSLKRTVVVSGLPVTGLSETGIVLREVRVQLGNRNCRGDLRSYQLRIKNPQGDEVYITKGLTTTLASVWANIKFRDDPTSLEMVREYSNLVQNSYFPYSIGYYNIDKTETFLKFNNSNNPNGDWTFEMIENTSSEVSFEKIELVFGSSIGVRDVTSCFSNDSCAGASCINNGVFRGNNSGYPGGDKSYPGNTVASYRWNDPFSTPPGLEKNGCSWNGSNDNSAWFSFKPNGSSARITISGMKANATGVNDMQPIVVKANAGCGIPITVPLGGCSDDININNRAYLNIPSIGGGTADPYNNGITANCEFNLTGLIPGDTYYLYVDGNGGATSFFYIEVENGVTTPCNFCCTPITVNGPTDVCSQATYTFTGGPGSGLEQWSVTPASAGTITPAGVFTPNPALNSEVNAVISFKKADCEGTLNVKVNKCFGILASAPFLKTCNSLGGEFFNTTGDATYRINPTNKTFTDTFLGNYVQNSGLLKLRGAEIKTFKNTALGGDVCGGVMFYRFFQTGSGAGNTSFNKLNLTFFSNCAGTGVFQNGGGTCQPGDQKWQANLQENLPVNQQIDLTKLSPGTYTLQVFYKIGGGVTPNPNCVDTVVLDNSGNYYNATFTIQGTGTPSLSGNNPTTCNGTDGSITISGLSPNGTYAVSYKDDGVDVGPLNLTANASGVISIGNLNAGAYTDFVLQASGGCLSGITLAATSTTLVNPKTTPSFGVIGPFCKDATAPSLPATSTNSINGTWSPATINTSAAGTTSYTFTPDDLTCSNSTSVNIVINDLPATPAIASTVATCNAAGSSTISNYDVNLTYTFNPAGPSVGAGGVISGMTISTDYTVTATNASTCSATSANFRNSAQLNAPDVPTINSTAPTCSAPGSSTIDNYDATLNYTFNPAGPVVGAGGVITGMTTGINYTVTATNSDNCSATSASFSNGAQLLPPAVPTINSTSATCTSAGTSTISNYDASLTYTFNPTGPSVGAGGAITGMTDGVNYSVTATNSDNCTSTASVNFKNDTQLPSPSAPSVAAPATVCSGSSVVFTISGTVGLTVNYTLNGTAGSTVINPGGTADVSVANATADQTLIITDIADATCPNNITDIETKVAVTNLSGSISAPSTACVGATPVVTFTGSGGTAPYSFEYSIDGGASQTITTTSGNSVTLPVSTSAKGTFKYDLINVSDANCSATVSGSATINIEDLTITTSKTDNKVCNGGGGTPGGCVPKGTGVVINEVMAQPVNAAGCSLNTFGNPNCQSIVEREYIELYNPTCNDIDISCYIIGTASRDDASPSSTTSTDFSIIIPNGTILAAKSHYVIGSTKLLTNPNNIDLKIDLNVSNLCSATGRSLLTNGDGWVALYDPTGAAKDAVYWTVSDNQASKIDNNDDDLNDTPCTPTATGCNTAGIVLQSATQIKTNNPSLINYAGRTNLSGTNPNGKTFSRVPDGGDWQRDIDPSIDGNNCNTTCDTNTPGTPGTCDGTATVTANGSGNYSFEWKDGSGKVVGSAATATGLCAGTYTVIVKDLTSNCEQTATVTINNEQPTLNVTNPAPVCAPATIDLTAAAITAGSTPNLIYSYWADKDTTIKITDPAKIDKSGTYYIKGANAGGCAEVKPVTVTITELNLTATTTKNTICNGGGTTPQPIPLKSAKEIFDNNAAQISYAGGSNVDEFKCGTLSNYIPNGKTFSRIPDGGAWQTDKAGSINDKNDPGACANCPTDIVINEILAQPDLNGCAPLACPYSSCFINEGLLNKEYIELYNPSSNPIDISGYMLATSTVNNSPSYSAGFTVRIPAGTILPPGKFYVIGSSNNANAAKVDLKVDLLTSNNYCFVKQGAIDNPVMQNGDGWLALYDAAGNVKDAMYWSLFLNEPNKITTAADNYDDAPCTLQKLNSGTCDGSATVSVNTGSGNYNYEWRDQAGTVVSNAITATGLCKGDYTVKVRDLTSLCEKTLTVTIEDEKPVLVIANPACSPTTVDLTLPAVTAGSTGGLSFTYWTDANATNALADPKKAAAGATYYIKGETSGGCTTDVKAVVAGQAPSFVLPPNVTLNHNDTYTGTNFNPTPAGTTIDWINSNTSIGLGASGTGNIVPFQAINTGNASAVATITITPKNGVCIGADQSFTITVIPTSKDVFVPNVLTPNGDGKNDVLKVYGNYITKLEMRIFNQWGELIKVINNPAMGWDGTHNGKPQPVGVYVFTLRATLADGSEITKKGSITLLR
ncbi:MAG: lamin tail domain-containing protein [Bacteroidetes bacterium]|nr:lamin tail domain-containing protein [Bacteroidota bacterium]